MAWHSMLLLPVHKLGAGHTWHASAANVAASCWADVQPLLSGPALGVQPCADTLAALTSVHMPLNMQTNR